jgi:hypothetical protein
VAGQEVADVAALDGDPRVVGRQAFRADAVVGVEGERALEEADNGRCTLVGMDLGVAEPLLKLPSLQSYLLRHRVQAPSRIRVGRRPGCSRDS